MKPHEEKWTLGVTITIQIENSDDKLTQVEWAYYVDTIRSAIARHKVTLHFFGASPNYEKWQNAAWVIAPNEHDFPFCNGRAQIGFEGAVHMEPACKAFMELSVEDYVHECHEILQKTKDVKEQRS